MTLTQGWRDPDDRLHSQPSDGRLIEIVWRCCCCFTPLVAVVVDGVNRSLPEITGATHSWQAVWTSLRIALAAERSGILIADHDAAVGSRELRQRQRNYSPDKRAGTQRDVDPRDAGIVLATGCTRNSSQQRWLRSPPAASY